MRIVAVDPPSAVQLALNEDIHVRVAYQSDQALRIQAAGYRDGVEVPGTTNASPVHAAGKGEALAWISYRRPTRIDTVRVDIHDAAWNLLVSMDYPMEVQWSASAVQRQEAAWVRPLQAAQQQAMQEAGRARSAASPDGGWMLLLMLLGWSVPGYLLAQVLELALWRGRWRKWAMLPLWLMVPVYAVTVWALLSGSNLWPIWLLFASPPALLFLLVLLSVRLLRHRTAPAS